MSTAHIVSPESGLASSVDPFAELNGGIVPAWLLNSESDFTDGGEPMRLDITGSSDPDHDTLTLNGNRLLVSRLGAYAINALALYGKSLEPWDLAVYSKGHYKVQQVESEVSHLADELNEAAGQELIRRQVTGNRAGNGASTTVGRLSLKNVYYADLRHPSRIPPVSESALPDFKASMSKVVELHERKQRFQGASSAPRSGLQPAAKPRTLAGRPSFGSHRNDVVEVPADYKGDPAELLWQDQNYKGGQVKPGQAGMKVLAEGFKPKLVKEAPIESADWRSRAVCRRIDPELFFPVGTSDLPKEQAMRVIEAYCAKCPVIDTCGQEPSAYGIWGGASRETNVRLNRETGRAEQVPEVAETITIEEAIERILAAKAMDSSVLMADAAAQAGGEEVDIEDDDALLAEMALEVTSEEVTPLQQALDEAPLVMANVASLYWGIGCQAQAAEVIAKQLGIEPPQVDLLLKFAERRFGDLLPTR